MDLWRGNICRPCRDFGTRRSPSAEALGYDLMSLRDWCFDWVTVGANPYV